MLPLLEGEWGTETDSPGREVRWCAQCGVWTDVVAECAAARFDAAPSLPSPAFQWAVGTAASEPGMRCDLSLKLVFLRAFSSFEGYQ